jgi:hypothetical protein
VNAIEASKTAMREPTLLALAEGCHSEEKGILP